MPECQNPIDWLWDWNIFGGAYRGNKRRYHCQASVSLDDEASDDMSEETELPEGESPIDPPAPQPISEADPNYKVFAKNFDEEVQLI